MPHEVLTVKNDDEEYFHYRRPKILPAEIFM